MSSKINLEEYQKRLSEATNTIVPISEYIGWYKPITYKCIVCNHEWEAKEARSAIRYGCPNCAGNAVKDSSTFEEELKITHPELQLLSPYIRSSRKVHVLCKDCNKDFLVTPNKLQQGQHCPHCKISHGERLIRDILTNLSIEFEMQKRFDDLKGLGNKKLSYDFYLPTYNLLIEFQGEQHEHPVIFKGLTEKIAQERFIRQQEHDKRKRNYAKEHNIGLLEIWYYDINLVEDILLKVLKADTSKSA